MKIRTEDRHRRWPRTREYKDRTARTTKSGIIIIIKKKEKKNEQK